MERKRKAEYPTDLRRFRFVGHRPTKRLSDDPSVRHFNSDAHLVIRRGKKNLEKEISPVFSIENRFPGWQFYVHGGGIKV